MNRTEIFEKLNKVFIDVFDDDSINLSESTVAKDIEDWDSLMHITLVAAIEDEFDCKFDMKDIIALENVGMMINLIVRETK